MLLCNANGGVWWPRQVERVDDHDDHDELTDEGVAVQNR